MERVCQAWGKQSWTLRRSWKHVTDVHHDAMRNVLLTQAGLAKACRELSCPAAL